MPSSSSSGIEAAPAQGFERSDPTCAAGLLAFRHGAAPPLLLQVLTQLADDGTRPPLRPTDVVRLVSLDQHAGVTTLEELSEWRRADVAALHGMGPKALGILDTALRDARLDWRP